MIIATVEIDAADSEPMAAKEAVAMALEHMGGVRVREVQVIGGQQQVIRAWNNSEGGHHYGKKTS